MTEQQMPPMAGTARFRFTLVVAATAAAILGGLPASASAANINVVAGMGEGGEDDQCSLREAITTANGNSAVNNGGAGPDCTVGQAVPDTISLPAGTYTIGGAATNEDLNASGDYDIQTAGGQLMVAGAGAASTIIDANDLDRVIHAFGSGNLILTALTVTDGTTSSAIGGGGGGILVSNYVTTTLTDIDVTNNVATSSPGGGISVSSPGDQIYTDVTVTGNDSNGSGTEPGGGGIYFAGGSSTLTDSSVSGNEVDHANDTPGIALGGGGISYDSAAVGTITRTTISSNSVDTVEPTQFPGGGGIFHEAAAGTLTIADSTISANTVTGGNIRDGGGMEWSSSAPPLDQLRIDNTTISGNTQDTGPDCFNAGSGTGC